MTNMQSEQIPTEAVEAAARADYERHFRTGVPWEARSEGWRDYGRAIVRPIVEAAAPYLTPEGTQPGCTGASDCPAPAHAHGCYADTQGHCDAPEDHAQPARVAPSEEEVAEKIRFVLTLAQARESWDGTDIDALSGDCAQHAFALFASQPTVPQVRERVAREMQITPIFEDTLPNDGEYEYTSDSDCDGSNKFYLRRRPRYEGSYLPWETTTQEAWQGAVDHYKREENDHG